MAGEPITLAAPEPGKESPQKPSILSRVAQVDKLVATVAAIVTAYGAYVAIQLNQVTSTVSRLEGERTYAKTIYEKYDQIVTAKSSSEQERIDRLAGLLTLADLVEHKDRRESLRAMVSGQITRYRQALIDRAADESSPTLNRQIAQYRSLERQAAAESGKTAWSNYDFDVFWCDDVPDPKAAEAMANKIVALRGADPAASGVWKAKRLSARGRAQLEANGYSIRYDYEDEKPFADALKRLLDVGGLPPAPQAFEVVKTKTLSTRWYISVFACAPK
jgi:hypothetical protein